MVATNRVVAVFVGLVLCAASLAQSDEASRYLVRSMQRSFPVNISAILLQRDPGNAESFQRVKVVRNKEGSMRCTILQPLRYQGFTLVDDGDRLRTYLPDENVILDQESPSKEPCEADEKLKLASKNYSFRMSSGSPIAGRQTVCVVATPHSSALQTRKYYLDAQNAYPLRLETFDSSKEITIVYDTKVIDFPKTVDSRSFDLDVVGAKVYRYNRPTKIVSSKQALGLMGFAPIVPEDLPFGFEEQEVQYSEGSDGKSIVIRLTDGLARATVYESSPETRMRTVENSTTRMIGNLRLTLVSDLPERIRMTLLQAFLQPQPSDADARTYGLLILPEGEGLQASLELTQSLSALLGIDGPKSKVQLGDADSAFSSVPWRNS